MLNLTDIAVMNLTIVRCRVRYQQYFIPTRRLPPGDVHAQGGLWTDDTRDGRRGAEEIPL